MAWSRGKVFGRKRYTLFAKGISPCTVPTWFPSSPTAVDSIRLSEGLEKSETAAPSMRGAGAEVWRELRRGRNHRSTPGGKLR